jgi:hypothetical protein
MARHAPYRWASSGDLNAFFGLSIDNLAVLVLTVSLLATVFGYPAQFALSHLVQDWRALKDSRELIEFSDQVRLPSPKPKATNLIKTYWGEQLRYLSRQS